jgi:hypothetical protein
LTLCSRSPPAAESEACLELLEDHEATYSARSGTPRVCRPLACSCSPGSSSPPARRCSAWSRGQPGSAPTCWPAPRDRALRGRDAPPHRAPRGRSGPRRGHRAGPRPGRDPPPWWPEFEDAFAAHVHERRRDRLPG